MNTQELIIRFKSNSLFKDSFWAVGGNGLGNALMLLSGILIARMLGKDLYGEYGMVKTTMFLMALFATFGLGDTSTKFIAEYLQKDKLQIRSIITASLKIVLFFSLTMCAVLLVFATNIAKFVNEPQLAQPFRFLGIIIVFRALGTVGAGILGGFKDYKRLGINNVVSGTVMLALCVPLTYLYNIEGALWALLISQIGLSVLNIWSVNSRKRRYIQSSNTRFEKEIISFSFPFALNEFVYTITSWGGSLLLAKYASLGELGMYTACTQWNAIILFMPSLLGNVILSYLSTTAVEDKKRHDTLIRRMLLINLICTAIPLIIVAVFSNTIARYYGSTFKGMSSILCVTILGTVFTCLTRVFQSNLMSEGRKWMAFSIRSFYNTLGLILTYVVLKFTNGINAAMNMSILSVLVNVLMLTLYYLTYRKLRKGEDRINHNS